MKLADLYRRSKVYNFRADKSKVSDTNTSPGLLAYAQHDIVEPKITTIDQKINPLMKSGDLGKEDHYETSEDDADRSLEAQRNSIKSNKEENQDISQFTKETHGDSKPLKLDYRSGNQYTPPSNPRHRKFMGYPPKSYN